MRAMFPIETAFKIHPVLTWWVIRASQHISCRHPLLMTFLQPNDTLHTTASPLLLPACL